MANFLQDHAGPVLVGYTVYPQTVAADGNGVAVDIGSYASNYLTATQVIGSVTALTGFLGVLQASIDGTTNWVNITNGAFANVTAANTSESITFQMPAAVPGVGIYRYVRLNMDITGTSAVVSCPIVAARRYDGAAGYQNGPPVGTVSMY